MAHLEVVSVGAQPLMSDQLNQQGQRVMAAFAGEARAVA
jgi:hypothetical protein